MTLTTIFYWRFILSVNCNSDGTIVFVSLHWGSEYECADWASLAVAVISVDWALRALISLAGRLYVRKNVDSEGRAFVAVTSWLVVFMYVNM
jgi:hypothetical protein